MHYKPIMGDGLQISILSADNIKPSSPTPQCQRKYSLSFLDQRAPLCFGPIIFFYKSSSLSHAKTTSEQLKKSLSQVLTKFYPLVGRLVHHEGYVDCNNDDSGVPYVEAEANGDLISIIQKPVVPDSMHQFLPYQVGDVQNLICLAAVQVTFFRCGGIAVGLMISHVIADMQSVFNFVNSWATLARHGIEEILTPPKFEASTIFPPSDHMPEHQQPRPAGWMNEELVTKIFTFSAPKISKLRDIYGIKNSDDDDDFFLIRPPSRFVALSAFILTRFISATSLRPNMAHNKYAVLLPANLRSRFNPPLSNDYFGNMSEPTRAILDTGDNMRLVMRKLTQAVASVNQEFVAQVMERVKYLDHEDKKVAKAVKTDLGVFIFTSFRSFPLYEIDFGWGKPAWVGTAPLPYMNVVTYFKTESGDGIEAWVCLEKGDMKNFETDSELQDFL